MLEGFVEGIYVVAKPKELLHAVQSVRAEPGRGLEGDRYCNQTGTFLKSGMLEPGREVTLIEREAIEAVARDKSMSIKPGESRRNIETRGVALNHLVGQEFNIGEVRIRGIKLCEPCGHLEKLTCKGIKQAFVHRGGLRAQILNDGIMRVGDRIIVHQPALSAACA